MTINSSPDRPEHYAPASKALHWIIAACILVIIPVGVMMNRVEPGPTQNMLYDLHRSLGFLVLVLVILRIGVRMTWGAPAPYVGLTRFERVASSIVHFLLYALLLAMPIVGWTMTSAFGATITVFGLFTLPHLVGRDEDLFRLLQTAHMAGAIAMAALVLLHVAGALMHTFVKRDLVLWRMLPRKWS